MIASKECDCIRTLNEVSKVVDPTKEKNHMRKHLSKESRQLRKVMQQHQQVRAEVLRKTA